MLGFSPQACAMSYVLMFCRRILCREVYKGRLKRGGFYGTFRSGPNGGSIEPSGVRSDLFQDGHGSGRLRFAHGTVRFRLHASSRKGFSVRGMARSGSGCGS